MIELKPCPFCGCEMNLSESGELIAWHRLDPICFFLLLEQNEVDMTAKEIHAEFLKAWNRRSNDAADAIEELLTVCREIAAFVIHYADDDEVSAEVLCRKLHKVGVIEKDGAWWALPEPPKEDAK